MSTPESTHVGPTTESESKVMLKAQVGNRQAQAAIYRGNREYILRRVRRIRRCMADSEDIVQEAFMAAFNSASPFRGQSSVRTYLTTIALRIAFRRGRHHRESGFDDETSRYVDRIQNQPPSDCDPWLRRTLNSEILQIPSLQIEALLHTTIIGKTYQEAANELRVPPGTVKSRAFLAKSKLRSRRMLQDAM